MPDCQAKQQVALRLRIPADIMALKTLFFKEFFT